MAGSDGAERRSRLTAVPSDRSCGRWRALRPPAVAAALTAAVFAPALWNGFVWDDQFNLVDNPHYRGLGWPQLRWMLTTNRLTHPGLGGQWIPVTWISFGVDYLVWGMNPLGYHLTNVLLHAADAALFLLVARRLLARALPSAGAPLVDLGAGAAALFFALHPLRAESVAWVTERRDVLSGLFFLLAVLLYLRAVDAEGRVRARRLGASVGCYALALASKSIVMTLPLVLLVLDAWPLRRLGRGRRRVALLEKLPYLVLAVAGAALAFVAARTGSALSSLASLSWPARTAIAVHSLWFYAWNTFVPLALSPLYEMPARVDPLAPRFVAAAGAVVAITAAAWLARRRWPAGLALWASYALMLAPVSGLAQAGPQLAAVRYSYLACLGWALLVGAGVVVAARAGAPGRAARVYARLAVAVVGVWIVALGALTVGQVRTWRDPESLWRAALEADPACAMCLGNLGDALERQGLWAPAIPPLERALALRPDYVGFHRNLGLALLRAGRGREAVAHFRLALEHYPHDAVLRDFLDTALASSEGGSAGEAGGRTVPPHLKTRAVP